MIFCTDLVLTKTSFWASFRIRGKTKKMFFQFCHEVCRNSGKPKPMLNFRMFEERTEIFYIGQRQNYTILDSISINILRLSQNPFFSKILITLTFKCIEFQRVLPHTPKGELAEIQKYSEFISFIPNYALDFFLILQS